MSMYSRIARACRNLFRSRKLDDEVSAELSAYIDELTERGTRRGEDARDARRAALLEVGGTEQIKELVREQRAGFELDLWLRDARHALRGLRRNPAFSVVGVGSLALGIGGLTAAFSLIDPLLFRRLPVDRPGDLVAIRAVRGDLRAFIPGVPEMYVTAIKGSGGLALAEFERLRTGHPVLSGVFAYAGVNRALRLSIGSRIPEELGEPVQSELASGTFFSTLGIAPILGRVFDDRDAAPGAEPVAVIGERLWHRRFGGDPDVIGTTIALTEPRRRTSVTMIVIGVAPDRFHGLEAGTITEIWRPFAARTQNVTPRNPNWWQGPRVVARLRPDVSLARARSELSTVYAEMLAGWTAEYGANWSPSQRAWFSGQRVMLDRAAYGFTSLWSQFGPRLLILFVALGTVFLIACANLSALVLARQVSRQRELALRLALGSSRYRLIRQLFVEGAILTMLGGVAGLAVAYGAGRLLVAWDSTLAAAAPAVSVDARVIVFALAATILSAVGVGLVPAIKTVKEAWSSISLPMHDLDRRNRPASRLNHVLIGAQVALAMILLVGAGLFLRTLHNLGRVDTGFDDHNLVLFSISDRVDIAGILARLDRLPGVESATVWEYGLLRGGVSTIGPIQVDGATSPSNEESWSVSSAVGPRFFSTLGISLVAGRDFEPSDALPGARRVAVISTAMARFFFGTQDPIGRFFRTGPRSEIEVIGVAEDATYRSLREAPQRMIYLPLERTSSNATFALRTSRPPEALADELRHIVQDLAPGARLSNLADMRDVAAATVAQERLLAQFSSGLSVLALSLACIGLYGTVAFAVAQRVGEIGIRRALGAHVWQVCALFARETLPTVVTGALIGLTAALATTHFIASLLFDISATDPLAMAGAAAVLVTMATGAALLAALKASRVDPLAALRHE